MIPQVRTCPLDAVGVIVAALFLIGLRIYVYLSAGVCKSKASMKGKTVLITGCTSGIGLETARDLAKRGARIVMACRDLQKANKIRDELAEESGNDQVIVRELDLSNLLSIREFAKQFNAEESRLDVLIHNAGTAETFTKTVSMNNIEMTMATNHYGPFLLTHLLIDKLKRSAPSRIVVVASSLYRIASLNLNNINPKASLPAYLYYVSKHANIVFTLELARRLEGTGVTANCLHPGMIDSGIWRSVPAPLSWGLRLIAMNFFKNPERGAQTSIYLAVAEELESANGKYFIDCQEGSLTATVKDPLRGRRFWELSKELVKLRPSDPNI